MQVSNNKVSFQSVEERRISPLLSPEEIENKKKSWAEEDLQNMLQLCKELEVEIDDQNIANTWYQLGLKLARKVRPARKKRGRAKKWDAMSLAILKIEVDRKLRDETGSRTEAWACQQLSRKEPWASFVEQNDTGQVSNKAETLRHMYQDAKKGKEIVHLEAFFSVGLDHMPDAEREDLLKKLVKK